MENIDFKHINDDLPMYGDNFDYNRQKSNWCVYAHINKDDGKIYIGISSNLKDRWSGNGKRYLGCNAIYDAFNDCGWDNFEHIVLMNGLTREMANIIEAELIKKYQTRKKDIGYNIASGGYEINNLYGKDHHMSKSVHQYDLNGIYIQSFDTICEATVLVGGDYKSGAITSSFKTNHYAYGFLWNDELLESMDPFKGHIQAKTKNLHGIIRVSISDFSTNEYASIHDVSLDTSYKSQVLLCCRSNNEQRLSYDGYFWFFINEYNDKKLQEKYLKYKNRFNGPVVQYDLNGNLIRKYKSAWEATDQGFVHHCITKICKEQNGVHKGYQWRFENDPPPSSIKYSLSREKYAAIDKNTHEVKAILYGRSEVNEFLNCNKSSIFRALKKPKSIAHGYYWRRVDNNGNIIWFDNDFLKEE